jgi:hypothetical protein
MNGAFHGRGDRRDARGVVAHAVALAAVERALGSASRSTAKSAKKRMLFAPREHRRAIAS